MRRAYRKTRHADGSVTIESVGPLRGGWLSLRFAIAALFLFATLVCLADAQWTAAGLSLLIAAGFLPNYRKLAKRFG